MEFSFCAEVARIAHGADEAAFVHRIWWLTYNNEANGRNCYDGKYWTYDSVLALAKIFDFWTPKQLRRIIKNCVALGLIETGSFAQNAFDRRTWYTVTEKVKSIYRGGQYDLPKRENEDSGAEKLPKGAEDFPRLGEPMRPKGETDLPEQSTAGDQSGKSDLPKQENLICPNGQMIKGAIKDLREDLREGAHACAPSAEPKRKRQEPQRTACGEFGNVMLSETEVDKLCSRWTREQVEQEIERLSAYIASKGVRYRNHYATLLNWMKREYPAGKKAGKLIEEDWV